MGDVDKFQDAEEAVAQMQESGKKAKKQVEREELAASPVKDTAAKERLPELIELEQISAPTNIRVGLAHLQELAMSIKERGLITPLLVRRATEGAPKPFELVAGRRRLEALKLLFADQASACVRCDVLDDLSEAEVYELMFTENIQREPLKPLETARALRHLLDLNPVMNAATLARSLGLRPGYIRRHLLMLDLPAEVQARVEAGDLSFTIADLLRRGQVQGRVSEEEVKKIAEQVSVGEVTTEQARKLVAPHVEEPVLAQAEDVAWQDLSGTEQLPLTSAPVHLAAEARERQIELERAADDLLSSPLPNPSPGADAFASLSPAQALDAYLLGRVIRDLLPDDLLAAQHLSREGAYAYATALGHAEIIERLRALTRALAALDSDAPARLR